MPESTAPRRPTAGGPVSSEACWQSDEDKTPIGNACSVSDPNQRAAVRACLTDSGTAAGSRRCFNSGDRHAYGRSPIRGP